MLKYIFVPIYRFVGNTILVIIIIIGIIIRLLWNTPSFIKDFKDNAYFNGTGKIEWLSTIFDIDNWLYILKIDS